MRRSSQSTGGRSPPTCQCARPRTRRLRCPIQEGPGLVRGRELECPGTPATANNKSPGRDPGDPPRHRLAAAHRTARILRSRAPAAPPTPASLAPQPRRRFRIP
ncbi:hypothetical protein NDU88_003041 [Pleurodeles waltl]|uniref:Uncharacterized protein n=1 Tax=Pleurodeles waltl TaxID=8319 RepID=A0AAV7SG29_PLEWA|nr:hypothetical protein NDU88_003041 [Pleurodeles waltl]